MTIFVVHSINQWKRKKVRFTIGHVVLALCPIRFMEKNLKHLLKSAKLNNENLKHTPQNIDKTEGSKTNYLRF